MYEKIFFFFFFFARKIKETITHQAVIYFYFIFIIIIFRSFFGGWVIRGKSTECERKEVHFVAFGKLCWLIFKQNKKEEEETREGFLASAKKKRKEKCLFNARVFVDFKWILKQNRVKKTHFHPTKLMTAPLFSFFFFLIFSVSNIFAFSFEIVCASKNEVESCLLLPACVFRCTVLSMKILFFFSCPYATT